MEQRPDPDERPVLGALRLAAAGVGKALAQDCWAMAEPTLGTAFAEVDELQRDLDRVAAALVAEVEVRGIDHTGRAGGSRASRRSTLTEWTRTQAPAMPERHRHQLVRVAAALADDQGTAQASGAAGGGGGGSADRPTLDAFRAGMVRLHRADLMLSTMAGIRPFLTKPTSNAFGADAGEDEDAAYQEILLPLAATGTDRDFATVAAHLSGLLRPEQDTDEADRACRAARSLTERPGPAGMTDFQLRADAVDAGTVRAAVAVLSAPVPDADGPDTRTPGQRRADALVTVIRRGMSSTTSCTGHGTFSAEGRERTPSSSEDHTGARSHDEDGVTAGTTDAAGTTRGGGTRNGCPAASPITLVITMTLDQLTGTHAGVATTQSGHPIPAGLARRMACDAAVIPAVLGTGSHVLDLGRTNRLASPAQRTALAIRDGGQCTYPGCSIPGTWCDVHHLVWWSRGGRTDLDQLTLLCRRHHTRVHDHQLNATIGRDGHTTWDVNRWDINRQ